MKLMTWNILASEWINPSYYPKIKKKTLLNRMSRCNTIIEHIVNTDADIILLQEVMQMEYDLICQKLKSKYNITPLSPIEWQYLNENKNRNESGNITCIRKGIRHGSISHHKLDFGIYTTISDISILNIHLDDWSSQSRHKQIKSIDELLYKTKKCIIGGDFNQHYTKDTKLYKLPQFTVHNTKCPTYYIEENKNLDNILSRGFDNIARPLPSSSNYLFYIDPLLQNRGTPMIEAYHRNIFDYKCNEDISDTPENIFIKYGSDHIPVIIEI